MTTNNGLLVWLREAGALADTSDPPQGLVFLHCDHNIKVFGYVQHVWEDLLSFDVVSAVRKDGTTRGLDYPVMIPIQRIILARYADLSDTDLPKDPFS